MRKTWTLTLAALGLAGCGGNALIGSWDGNVNAPGAPSITVTLTLRADQTQTATSEFGFGSTGVIYSGCISTTTTSGTWSSTSTTLSLDATAGTTTMSGCDNPADEGTRTLGATDLAASTQTSSYEFVNPDLLRLTGSSGAVLDLRRR